MRGKAVFVNADVILARAGEGFRYRMGAARGANPARSPSVRGYFRTIFVEKVTAGGKWRLRLENKGEREAVAVISAWDEAVKK